MQHSRVYEKATVGCGLVTQLQAYRVFADSGVRSHLYASAVAAQPGPSMRLLGSRAAYIKFGMDPQEEMLRAGVRPGDPGWGEEPPERWGRIGSGDEQRVVPTLPLVLRNIPFDIQKMIRTKARHERIDNEEAVIDLLRELDIERAVQHDLAIMEQRWEAEERTSP